MPTNKLAPDRVTFNSAQPGILGVRCYSIVDFLSGPVTSPSLKGCWHLRVRNGGKLHCTFLRTEPIPTMLKTLKA